MQLSYGVKSLLVLCGLIAYTWAAFLIYHAADRPWLQAPLIITGILLTLAAIAYWVYVFAQITDV